MMMQKIFVLAVMLAASICLVALTSGKPVSATSVDDDKKAVAMLDTKFQAATKINDAAAISKMLPDDYILITGKGKVVTKADLVKAAENKDKIYERQDESNQTVRVWGNTAVVTCLLWLKGKDNKGKAFDFKLWYSDTYVRTPNGWSYVFGQASMPLSDAELKQ